ncbi:MAG: hypothetical protein LBJ08_07950 [Bifidobacteriaceae bacterium]|jgi:hypothetical protein|nr:hypothetical protein [Bifidobacteriaceae bacterium]
MTNPSFTESWGPDAEADLATLNDADPELADAALAAVADVTHRRKVGKALGARNVSGDLTGLRRLRFDH